MFFFNWMHMFYWFGTKLENFLFQGYDILTTSGLVSTCFGLTALAILYEAMKLLQVKLSEIAKESNEPTDPPQSTDSSSLLSRASRRSTGNQLIQLQCSKHAKWFMEVLHWSLHVTLGYLLMLTVMTFNGYITIALVIGSGIGYYIFGPILLEMNMKKLVKRRRLIQCNPVCSDAVENIERRNSATSVVSDNIEPEVNIEVDIDVHS